MDEFIFYVNRWITDPEVDSPLSGRVFLPLVSDSHLLFVACGVHDLDFLGDDFRNYSRIQRYFGPQWIHVGFSLRGVWKNFTFFLRSGGLWETTSGLSPYSALSSGRQWIHVGFSPRGVWLNFTRFLSEGRRRPFRSAEADPHGPAS